MKPEDKKRLMADLLRIAEETRQFKPPYIPSRYLQDLANSDPAELVYKYVMAKDRRTASSGSGERRGSISPLRTSRGSTAICSLPASAKRQLRGSPRQVSTYEANEPRSRRCQ
jgi:hypothetical protein